MLRPLLRNGRICYSFGHVLRHNLLGHRYALRGGYAHLVAQLEPGGILESPGHHDDVGTDVLVGQRPQRSLTPQGRLRPVVELLENAWPPTIESARESDEAVLADVDASSAEKTGLFQAGIGQRTHLGVDAFLDHVRTGWALLLEKDFTLLRRSKNKNQSAIPSLPGSNPLILPTSLLRSTSPRW